jgi:hypothetical protein
MAEDFDLIQPDETAFRLDLTPPQLEVTRTALRSLRDDFGHEEHDIQGVIRAVLDKLPGDEAGERVRWLELTPAQLKLTYTGLRSLLDGYGHDEHREQQAIRQVLDKLPDEHAIRSIDLRRELRRTEGAA